MKKALVCTRDSMTNRRRERIPWGLLGVAVLALMKTAQCDDDSLAPDSKAIKQLKEIYRNDATEYSIYRDAELLQKLELREEPAYIWTNVVRGQSGSVFVWTWHGRPEVIASIFSQPTEGGRREFVHELHSLSTATLVPQRLSANQWVPKAGLKRMAIPGAPKPAELPRQRLIQMRDLTKEFTARSESSKQEAWELRLLPQPMFRYQSNDSEVIDGALFAFVTSAGTDPEVLLVIEAVKEGDAAPIWTYAIGRFSDHSLYVSHREKEIWTSVRGGENSLYFDAKHLYRLFIDRTVNDKFAVPERR